MSFISTFAAATVAIAIAFAMPALAEGIEVHEAYAIQATPMSPSGAVFMVIHNHGGPDDHLTGARTDVAARTELHTHRENADGVMQMIHVEEGYALPNDGEIIMARGGNHVMLMGITAPLVDGETFPLTLIFETAGEHVVDVLVDLDRMTGDQADKDHSAMDHGN